MMPNPELHAVTGAFGFSGRYIASRLLAEGRRVRTLTNSSSRGDPFGGKVEVSPYHFKAPELLTDSLRGVSVLYNTYWVRFNHKTFTHSLAVENTLKLFEAAKQAGVRRIVHVSITNPSLDSPLEYFRGKAQLERALIESSLSCAILRPAVLFGEEDILINNIAWTLRHFPVFGVFGDGEYRLQPIHVDDFAELAVEKGRGTSNEIIDAIGPETFTFRDLVKTIGEIIGKPRPVVSVPPALGYSVCWVIGKWMGDTMITWEEVKGLMQDLLCTDSAPSGRTKLTEWVREHSDTFGVRYASELARRR
jgi:NADH dehydrogenase